MDTKSETTKRICHICKHPIDAIGSEYCSYPHPVSRDHLHQEVIRGKIEELKGLVITGHNEKDVDLMCRMIDKRIADLQRQLEEGE